MILLDFSQVMISNIFVELQGHTNAPINESMLRHMVLNSLKKYRQKMKSLGEMVICVDSKKVWRKDVFPYYKHDRREKQSKDELDWGMVNDALARTVEEVRENIPYKVVQVARAEADDIIGTLVHRFGTPMNNGNTIMIVSRDKDFMQLHTYGNVKQYCPITDALITSPNPERYLTEHILKGDSGDGIPNVMSEDDFFVTRDKGQRQKPVTKKRIDEWSEYEGRTPEIQKRFIRNRELIDLSYVPKDIQAEVCRQYDETIPAKKDKIFPYLVKNGLSNMLEHANDF